MCRFQRAYTKAKGSKNKALGNRLSIVSLENRKIDLL